jgi:branched-chain amino acid transport system ATP-binding protein
MGRPKFLLLDEPSLRLAPRIVEEIFGIIRQISAEGTAVLLVERNAAIALNVASAGCVLDLSEVTLRGTSKELRNPPTVRASYL